MITQYPPSNTPSAHATTHQSGGGDPIKLDDLAAPDDNTDLNASTSAHGLLPKLPNDATKFLNGAGAYSVPASSGATGNLVLAHRNGPNVYLSTPSNSAFDIGSPSKFTVRAWVYLLAPNTNNGIATRSSLSSSQGDWSLSCGDGSLSRLAFRVNNAAGGIFSTTTLVAGRFYFVEGSYDSSLGSNNLKLFIDGVLDVQGNYSTVITNNANPIRVGGYFDTVHGFYGYISEFEFAVGVVRNTTNYTPPAVIAPDANTVVHYSMNEYTVAGVTDDSGNGFNATWNGVGANPYDTAVRKL